ncbi:MAG: glutamyl-tRNA reductase [Elusimicrobia bacterium]|nr:glutamyl-tRNA reductase [Elusimicrobiota bacterium]
MITLQSMDLKYALNEREKYFYSLEKMKNNYILLHTCNRTEAYQGNGDVPEYIVRHLFRVVCGIESALLGETAIQGQVKSAYEKARDDSYLSPQLHKLFQHALRVGKRARSETDISKGAMTHGRVVIEVLKRDRVDMSVSKILIIGVNNFNESVVKYITEKGNKTVFVANRTYKKAFDLSIKYCCKTVRFNKLNEEINSADIIISATSSPHLIVKKSDFITDKQMLIFDLAVPRDIDPEIGILPNVTLYNIEDVEKKININKNKRINEIKRVEEIIEEEIRVFHDKK